MEQNKIMIMLKPKVKSDDFVRTMKVSGFTLDNVIKMDAQGSVIVGFCNKATRAFIKTLPNVLDIEDAHPVNICLDEDGNKIEE